MYVGNCRQSHHTVCSVYEVNMLYIQDSYGRRLVVFYCWIIEQRLWFADMPQTTLVSPRGWPQFIYISVSLTWTKCLSMQSIKSLLQTLNRNRFCEQTCLVDVMSGRCHIDTHSMSVTEIVWNCSLPFVPAINRCTASLALLIPSCKGRSCGNHLLFIYHAFTLLPYLSLMSY